MAASDRTGRQTVVIRRSTIEAAPIDWWPPALHYLHGIEPYEVSQALAATNRWPRHAVSHGVPTLTIWARTRAGRGLIIALRPTGAMRWEIIGVRAMTPDEVAEFDGWEASR